MVKLVKALFGVPDGEVYPREFSAGEDCPPELEDAAREIDALEANEDAPKRSAEGARAVAAQMKAMKPEENK